MASMFMSNFMMLLPETTKWFCIIGLAVFFFGIYIPYDKYKQKMKKGGKWPPRLFERKPVKEPIDRKQAEQLKTLREAGILSEEEYQEKKRELR